MLTETEKTLSWVRLEQVRQSKDPSTFRSLSYPRGHKIDELTSAFAARVFASVLTHTTNEITKRLVTRGQPVYLRYRTKTLDKKLSWQVFKQIMQKTEAVLPLKRAHKTIAEKTIAKVKALLAKHNRDSPGLGINLKFAFIYANCELHPLRPSLGKVLGIRIKAWPKH